MRKFDLTERTVLEPPKPVCPPVTLTLVCGRVVGPALFDQDTGMYCVSYTHGMYPGLGAEKIHPSRVQSWRPWVELREPVSIPVDYPLNVASIYVSGTAVNCAPSLTNWTPRVYVMRDYHLSTANAGVTATHETTLQFCR